MRQTFQIADHNSTDKAFKIIPPEGWEICLMVDYDDVDHERVDKETAKIVGALNVLIKWVTEQKEK